MTERIVEGPSPRFSVCIPTLNRSATLGRAIESALAQADDVEVIVVDNASDDDTPAVVAAYGTAVRYIRQPSRVPMGENHRTARHAATGRYVSLLFDDEVLLPGSLERRAAILDRHPDVVAVGASSAVLDGDELRPGKAIRRQETIEDRPTFLRRTFGSFIASVPCWLVRREVSNQIELRPNELPAADNGIVLRLSRHGRLALVPDAAATITPGDGEQSRDGTMEVVPAFDGGRPQLPTLTFATGVYRVSIDHLNESDDLSLWLRWRLGARARGRMRLVIWNAALLRLKVTRRPGPAIRFLASAVSIGPSMLLPPLAGAARRFRAGGAVLTAPPDAVAAPMERPLGQPAIG